MPEAIINAFTFLINTLAQLYVFLLIARMLLIWVHADYYNPVTQVIAKLTDPLVLRLKRRFPTRKGIELASLALILGIELLKFFLLSLLTQGYPNLFGLMLLSFADTLKLTVNVFFYAILMQIILSWFPYRYQDVYRLLALITSPIMRPLRRVIPPIGGIDISPIPALIGLQFLVLLLVDPLYSAGMNIAFS